jgi:hypothetical protein
VKYLLASMLAAVYAKSVPEENPLLKLGSSLFGLASSGNNNNNGWNPLALLSMGGEKKDGDQQPNTAKHFASIASGFNGLFKDVLNGAAKLAETSTEVPTTTPPTKDPIGEGIGRLISGFFNRRNNGGEKSDIK